eukprot:SAG31_NODE_87_length_26728_cov_40.161591_27_plen_291_part_01
MQRLRVRRDAMAETQSSTAANSSNNDDLEFDGNFSADTAGANIAADADFGDFGEFGSKQSQAQQPMADPFDDFGSFTITPPAEASTAADADFGSFTPPAEASTAADADFGSFTPPAEASTAAADADFGSFTPPPAEASTAADADFGDFGGCGSSSTTDNAIVLTDDVEPSTDLDGFGAFAIQGPTMADESAAGVDVAPTMSSGGSVGEDFVGGFDDGFGSTGSVAAAEPPSEATTSPSGEDDFGGFGETVSASTASASTAGVDVAPTMSSGGSVGEDFVGGFDDGFGSTGS